MKKAAKKNAVSKGCNCVDIVNVQLKPFNTKIVQCMEFNFRTKKGRMSGPLVEVEKIDKKKKQKASVLTCTYCPFCGKKSE